MRTIGVVTVARSDYGIYAPLLRKIQKDPELNLHLIVSGMHLSPDFGSTVGMIEADGFRIADRVEMLLSSDTPEGISKSMGLGAIGFAQCFAKKRPDILVLLGDRFEMHAAALAALPFRIPVAHIHGGEITEGAMDNALRHSITKLSHLHFASTEAYGRRIIQMGEEPWRVTVSGAPSLDNLHELQRLQPNELEMRFGLDLSSPPLLVTFHPTTLEYDQTQWQAEELLAALAACDLPLIFTLPNADTDSRTIISMIRAFVARQESAQLVSNLGTEAYFSAMALASAMVGNSSSGIIEAASFNLPVVNIGTRQTGRVRGNNVIDTGYRRDEIVRAIQKATDPGFRANLKGHANPYGDGRSAPRILRVLKETALDGGLIKKRFYDIPVPDRRGPDGR